MSNEKMNKDMKELSSYNDQILIKEKLQMRMVSVGAAEVRKM